VSVIPLLKVTTVYGDTCYIGAEDHARARHMVSLRHRNGIRFEDDRRGGKNGRCTMIAIENIASTEPVI
jgi:hypothetical protein